MIHDLKTWPQYFARVWNGTKNFEVRKNDRDYQINDILLLREYDPEKNEFTGCQVRAKVTYILHGGSFGIEKDYCVMAFERV